MITESRILLQKFDLNFLRKLFLPVFWYFKVLDHGSFEVVGDLVQKLKCIQIVGACDLRRVAVLGADGEILCHRAALNRGDADLLQGGAVLGDLQHALVGAAVTFLAPEVLTNKS